MLRAEIVSRRPVGGWCWCLLTRLAVYRIVRCIGRMKSSAFPATRRAAL
jgi:hypothetical protein